MHSRQGIAGVSIFSFEHIPLHYTPCMFSYCRELAMAVRQAILDGDEKLACTLVFYGANEEGLGQLAGDHQMEMLMMLLLRQGYDFEAERKYSSALWVATAGHDNPCMPIIRMLLETGVGREQVTYGFEGLLCNRIAASFEGEFASQEHYDAMELFIKTNPWVVNADIRSELNEKCSPLHVVGDKKTLSMLLWSGADLESRDAHGNTPLTARLIISHKITSQLVQSFVDELVQSFVDAGADVNTRNNAGATPLLNYLQDGCVCDMDIGMLDILLRSGADETAVDNHGEGAMEYLHRYGEGEYAGVLKLLANAPVDRRWRRRGLVVMCIARHGRGFLEVQPVVVSRNSSNAWPGVARRLVEIGTGDGTQGIFRTIVGFL